MNKNSKKSGETPSNADDPVIVKAGYYPGGIDLTLTDITYAHSIRVVWTKVVVSMYKEKSQAFIGLKDILNPGEVIQVPNSQIKYRVIGVIKANPKGGWIHRIKRVDGFNITGFDLGTTSVGQKIRIPSRKSSDQIFEQIIDIGNELYSPKK